MRATDLQTGTDYCVGKGYSATRVTLLSSAAGKSQVRHTAGHTTTVRNRDITSTWADHLEAVKDAADSKARRIASMERAIEARNAAHARLTALVPDEALPWWARSDQEPACMHNDRSGIYGLDAGLGTLTLTVVDLLKIAEGALARAAEQQPQAV